jgi:hypothetical protein
VLQRRTGLFSATQTKEVKELARAGMRNPVTICVKVQRVGVAAPAGADGSGGVDGGGDGSGDVSAAAGAGAGTGVQVVKTPATLSNFFLTAPYDRKPAELVAFLAAHASEKTIVFFLTCAAVDFYSRVLPFTAAAVKSSKVRRGIASVLHRIAGCVMRPCCCGKPDAAARAARAARQDGAEEANVHVSRLSGCGRRGAVLHRRRGPRHRLARRGLDCAV